jgi:hypothetical protein
MVKIEIRKTHGHDMKMSIYAETNEAIRPTT